MQFSVTARNVEITPALRAYAEEKLSRLTRYLENIVTLHVVLSVNKHRQTAEVTLRVRDLTIRAEEEGDDLYSSIDLVAEKLERQILRYKERILAHAARGGNRGNRSTIAAAVAEEEPRVVKTKRFAVKPVGVDEAILQMNLLGHNFYVFRNATTEQVNVIYRRQDGHYGLIEPED
ncbi:MAG TPA: ribosome-associated translation inhibitor RaiA [Candidatus Methylomirabilis sp.]|nr:ribosome-associated translation inhibitor RaiA [Candidatus Methylomirabilis sp.]